MQRIEMKWIFNATRLNRKESFGHCIWNFIWFFSERILCDFQNQDTWRSREQPPKKFQPRLKSVHNGTSKIDVTACSVNSGRHFDTLSDGPEKLGVFNNSWRFMSIIKSFYLIFFTWTFTIIFWNKIINLHSNFQNCFLQKKYMCFWFKWICIKNSIRKSCQHSIYK